MRKSEQIIAMALANPDWTQGQVAEYCDSTAESVKVILCRARKAGKIGARQIDQERSHRVSLDWLPAARRSEYANLRRKVGAAEAQRMMRAELERRREHDDQLA